MRSAPTFGGWLRRTRPAPPFGWAGLNGGDLGGDGDLGGWGWWLGGWRWWFCWWGYRRGHIGRRNPRRWDISREHNGWGNLGGRDDCGRDDCGRDAGWLAWLRGLSRE